MTEFEFGLQPDELEDTEHNATFVHSVCSRISTRGALFAIQGASTDTVFISSNPGKALKWMCERVDKRRLLQTVAAMYATTDPSVEHSNKSSADEDPSGSDTRKRKRKSGYMRETTEAAQRKRQPRLDRDILRTLGDATDHAHSSRYSPLNEEQQRYRSFSDKLPGVGNDVMIGMISKAAAVATTDCLRDWQTVLRVWRSQHQDGKRLFSGPITRYPIVANKDGALVLPQDNIGSQSQLMLSQSHRSSQKGLSHYEASEFKNLYFAAQENHAAGIVGDMRHRWIMAAMYAAYEALETLLRDRAQPSGGRGRGFATIAKEQLFSSVYNKRDGTNATREDCPSEWKEFGHWLDYGKRWAMLQQRFGVGIFALLPRTAITNTYIERTLSVARFSQWVDMIVECNLNVRDMVEAIQPLYTSCMTNEAPPAVLLLEDMDENSLKTCDPVFVLTPLEDCERMVEEVQDETDDDILVPSTGGGTHDGQ